MHDLSPEYSPAYPLSPVHDWEQTQDVLALDDELSRPAWSDCPTLDSLIATSSFSDVTGLVEPHDVVAAFLSLPARVQLHVARRVIQQLGPLYSS